MKEFKTKPLKGLEDLGDEKYSLKKIIHQEQANNLNTSNSKKEWSSKGGNVSGKKSFSKKIGIHTTDETLRKEWAALGGYAVVDELNDKNRENGHWKKLAESKIGVPRTEDTKAKIQKGTAHSWRTISQYSKDGEWIRDWDNFADIEIQLSVELGKKIVKQPIWSVCNNKPKCKTAYGFIWKYKNNL